MSRGWPGLPNGCRTIARRGRSSEEGSDSSGPTVREETVMRKANRGLTRREMLQRSAAGAVLAAPWFVPAAALGRDGKPPPSERITLGVIGIGPRGTYDLKAMLTQPNVQCVAVCVVQASRREAAKQLVDEH